MNNGILYVSCGVPGSGKSTFLEEVKGENEVIISRDKIRFAILKPGEDYFSHEKEVYSNFLYTITNYINKGINVYADATHLNEKSRYKLLYELKNRGCKPSEINAIYFNVPLKICLERNQKRFGTKTFVPEDSLMQMYGSFTVPQQYEGFNNIYSVDEDGYVDLVEEDIDPRKGKK